VAARTLGATPCATIAIDVAPVAAISAGDDGMNAVVWETDAWPSAFVAGAAAQTVLTVDAQGHFRDADIHLNAHDYTFTIAGEPGSIDLRGVLTHELGHVLGLCHSDDPVATMFASTAD